MLIISFLIFIVLLCSLITKRFIEGIVFLIIIQSIILFIVYHSQLSDSKSEAQKKVQILHELSNNVLIDWDMITDQLSVSDNYINKYLTELPKVHFSEYIQSLSVISKEILQAVDAIKQRISEGKTKIICEFKIQDTEYNWIWVTVRCLINYNSKGVATRLIGIMEDTDEAKKIELHLRQKAEFDDLTGFYNRVTFEEIANEKLKFTKENKEKLGFLFVDIDNFRDFNNVYGHAFGDRVLRFIANVIRQCIPENGFAGRNGGDEFVVCIENPKIGQLQQIAEHINQLLQTEFKSRDYEAPIKTSCSIGIAVFPDSGESYEEIIHQADDAMYSVKKQGKGHYVMKSL